MFIDLDKAILQEKVYLDNAAPYIKGSRCLTLRLSDKFGLQGAAEDGVPCNTLPELKIDRVREAIIAHAGASILVETHERVYSKYMIHPVIHDFYGMYGVQLTWPRIIESKIGTVNGARVPQPLIFSLFVPKLTALKAGTPFVKLYFQTENKASKSVPMYPRSLESMRDVMARAGEAFNENGTAVVAKKEEVASAGAPDSK